MIKILQSPWFAALAGCLIYLSTTVAVLSPAKFAHAEFIKPDYSAENDPSWKFKNPEFNQWLSQIKDEKDALAAREQQLNELQTRLDAEKQEISTVTQLVAQLQTDFDKNVIRFKTQETENVRHQAKLISAMPPESAAAMISQMPDDDAVKILFVMKTDDASALLDALSKIGGGQSKRAATLTEKLHQVLPSETTAASNQ